MKRSNIILTIAGGLLAIAGLGFVLLGKQSGAGLIPAFLAAGVGWGLFGHNLGQLLAAKAARTNPEQARQIAIEQQDERNVALSNLAKAKAYDAIIYIFSALMLVFALGQVAVWAVLALVAACLAVVCLYAYYLNKFQKEM